MSSFFAPFLKKFTAFLDLLKKSAFSSAKCHVVGVDSGLGFWVSSSAGKYIKPENGAHNMQDPTRQVQVVIGDFTRR